MWNLSSDKMVPSVVFSFSCHNGPLFETPCVCVMRNTNTLAAFCFNTVDSCQRIIESNLHFGDGTPICHKSANYTDFWSVAKLTSLCWGKKSCSPCALSNPFCNLFSSTHCWLWWALFSSITRNLQHSDGRMRSIFLILHLFEYRIYASWDHWVMYRLAHLLPIFFYLRSFLSSSCTVHENSVYPSTIFFCRPRATPPLLPPDTTISSFISLLDLL